MPKQVSNIKVQGTIDGITYYQVKGEFYAKPYSRISKEDLQKSPKFESLRRNQVEFGGSMKTMSGFREGFDSVSGQMFDSILSKRVGAIFKTMITRNQERRDKRPVRILANKDLLEGFELNDSLWLNQVFKAGAEVAINAERNEVTLKTEGFSAKAAVVPPALATHFEIINHVSLLSDYEFSEAEKGYVPVDKVNNSKYTLAASAVLPVIQEVVEPLTLTVTLTPEVPLSPSCAVIASVGIRFYEEHNGKYYLLGMGGAMKVKRVW